MDIPEQHIPGQGTLSAAAYSGYRYQFSNRQFEINVFQVVGMYPVQQDPVCIRLLSGYAPALRCKRMFQRVFQPAARRRVGGFEQLRYTPGEHYLPAVYPSTRTYIDYMIGRTDCLLVVFDNDYRVALVLEHLQRVHQHAVVPRMQSDSRLIQDVAYPPQIGAELRRQANALGLTAAEGGSRPVEVEIAQADLFQKAEPGFQLFDSISGNLGTATSGPVVLEKGAGLLHRHAVEIGDGLLCELY